MLLFVLASLAIASPTGAAGGTSLKTAPFMSSGETYTANFSSDHLHGGNAEFWKPRLVSGDELSLDGTRSRQARYLAARIFPAGTDDATLARRRPLYEGKLSSLIQLVAPQTGAYPLEVTCGTKGRCGAIKFVVSITHEVSLYVARATSLAMKGTFTVVVRSPVAHVLTSRSLIISLYGLWPDNNSRSLTHHVIGSAITVDGKAKVDYQLPPGLTGQTISLQATSAGSGYRSASSSLCKAKVT